MPSRSVGLSALKKPVFAYMNVADEEDADLRARVELHAGVSAEAGDTKLRDDQGCEIEDFGLPENLMLWAEARRLFVIVTPDVLTDLTGLELALDAVEPLLEPAAAPFEDAQADLHVGATEEGEADVEVVVLPRSGTDLRHEVLELAVTGIGHLVDDARATRDSGDRASGLLDQVGPEHLLQRGVERSVGEHPTPAEHEVEPLAQLVAVHGSLVQQPEDCQLDGLCTTCHATYRSDISTRCESVIGTTCP